MAARSRRALIALAVLAAFFVLPTTQASGEGRYQEHENVFINNDRGFNPANGVRSGAGTAQNPYVISGWNIQHLELKDTDAHVKIVNNQIDTLVLDWADRGLLVKSNVIGDLRVNQNVKRKGAPSSGLISNNTIGVVGQLRHFDGAFVYNTVGTKNPDVIQDAFSEVFDNRAVNFDGFNGAHFAYNTIYGYMDARLHGHHHSSGYGDTSHHHSAAHEGHGMEMDHTKRWHQVWIHNNTIYADYGYSLAYLDTAHSANDRTANSEENKELNKPHVHHTKVHIANNKLFGGGLYVDVFNAKDQRHTGTARGLVELRNNSITMLRDQIDLSFQTLHGLTVEQARDINLKVIGNRVIGPSEESPLANEKIGLIWDWDAGILLSDIDKGRLELYGNRVTNREHGILARNMSKTVRWFIDDLSTKNVQRPVYYDSTVANKPERRP